MRAVGLVIVIIISAILAVQLAEFNKAYAQLSLDSTSECPIGQAPVLGPDGNQATDPYTGLPMCSPIDTFNNLFGY